MSTVALEKLLAPARPLPFVVLVGWLEQLLASRAEVGGLGPYLDEPVRFRHDPALIFQAQDVTSIKLLPDAAEARFAEVETTFAGLTGAASPLPSLMLEELAQESEYSEELEFLDLFHHRLLGLFYRGLLKFDLPRTVQSGREPRALDWLLRLGGLDPARAERVTGLSRQLLLQLVPLLVSYPANAERIAVALRAVFAELLESAAVHVHEMRGGYVRIDEGARPRLGVDLRLGRTSTLGGRAPAPASAIVVAIGPLSPERCLELSPSGHQHATLSSVIALLCPETIQVWVELTPSHTPPARLKTPSARLGQSAWLGGRGRPEPVRFSTSSMPARRAEHAR